jgi:hypothetical protein
VTASPKHVDVGSNASWPYGVFDTIANQEPAGSIGLSLAAESAATFVVALDSEAAAFRGFLNRAKMSSDSHFNAPMKVDRRR